MPEKNETKFLKPADVFNKLKIEQGMHAADFGCGNLGYFIIPLAKMIGQEGKAYAVDIMQPVLEAVKSKAKVELVPNITTVWGNLEQQGAVDIPEQSLDIGLLINVLYQNKDHLTVLQEAARLLKPQGILVAIDWKKTNIVFGPPVETRVDQESIAQLGPKTGLTVTDYLDFGEYFWGIIFTKK